MSVLAAGIAGGAALAGGALSAYSTGKLNRRGERFADKMYHRQRADALSDWDMMNAYNDPSAQMQRLQDAGLNPNLVYGESATATAAAPPRQSNTSQPQYKQPDFGGIVHQALSSQQQLANIRRTEAETQLINERTGQQKFENVVREMVGEANFANAQRAEQDIVQFKSDRERNEYHAWETANFSDELGKRINADDPNSPLAKAYRAGIARVHTDLENARSLGDIRRYETIIKQFESNLTKQGISPNSPWYVKILTDLSEKVLGQPFLNHIRSEN